MKLGIDASNLLEGGGITHLEELLAAAEPRQFEFSEVVVWGRASILDRLPSRDWLRLRPEPSLDHGLIRRTLWRIRNLDRELRDAGCDLLFVPGGSYTGSFRPFVSMSRNLLPFDKSASRLYGMSLMRLKFLVLRRVQSTTFRAASGMIFLTSGARRQVLEVTGPLQAPSEIIPHGVSTRFFSVPRPQRPMAAYSKSHPYRLLYVSPLEPYKHQNSVVAAVQALGAEGYPVVLDLVGGGSSRKRARLALLAAGPNSGQVVEYHGPVGYSDLAKFYHGADMFVFASSCENLPNILIEAMSAGLPIASSNRSVMPEVLGTAGAYFDPEQPSSIAQSLRSLLDDCAGRQRYAREAQERIRESTWARCAKETFAFLRSVCLQANRGPHRD